MRKSCFLKKIGFTETQYGMTSEQKKKIRSLFNKYAFFDIELHHGDCIDADVEVHEEACYRCFDVVIHPPINSSKRCTRDFNPNVKVLKRKDYLPRNRDIIGSTKILIGTPKTDSEPNSKRAGGTWYTIRYARGLKRKIYIVWPDGHVSEEN